MEVVIVQSLFRNLVKGKKKTKKNLKLDSRRADRDSKQDTCRTTTRRVTHAAHLPTNPNITTLITHDGFYSCKNNSKRNLCASSAFAKHI
jgi:hypothetical protein